MTEPDHIRPAFIVETLASQLRQSLCEYDGRPGKPPEAAFEGLVTNALDQVYSARDAFVTGSQNALATMLASYTAGAAIYFWLITCTSVPPAGKLLLLLLLATLAFALPWLLRKAWLMKNAAGYNLYVSSCLHAAVLYEAFSLPRTHMWLEYVWSCKEVCGIFQNPKDNASSERDQPVRFQILSRGECQPIDSVEKLIAVWCARGPNVFRYFNDIFAKRTRDFAIFSLLMGLALLAFRILAPSQIWN